MELALYWGELSDEAAVKKIKNKRLSMQQRDFETIIVHFRTLGVIESGQKKRVPSDTNKYLRLTSAGQQKLAALMAVRKSEKESTAKKAPAKKAPAKKAAAKKAPAKKAT